MADTPYHREYFYVGGTYVPSTSDFGGCTMKDQTYVERLTPVDGPTHGTPLIFVHGAGQSGLNWLHTPDGRRGWASCFLGQGYETYLIDTASRGRSPHDPKTASVQYSTGFVEEFFTACKVAAKWPQARLHTQWPGTGQRGDPIFDAFYASILPSAEDLAEYQHAQKAGVTALLKKVGRPCVLITHSQGAPAGWLAADACPELVKAIVAIEPNGPPFAGTHPHNGAPARLWGITDIPIEFEPPVATCSDLHLRVVPPVGPEARGAVVLQDDTEGHVVHKLRNLENIPVLVEVGEASYHAVFDHATVDFLRQAGVSCDLIRLEDRGIKGNGHMQMLELNNLEIAEILQEWIEKHT